MFFIELDTPLLSTCFLGCIPALFRRSKRCSYVIIRPLAGSAQRHVDNVVGHKRIHADHDGRMNSALERRATDRTDRTLPTNLIQR